MMLPALAAEPAATMKPRRNRIAYVVAVNLCIFGMLLLALEGYARLFFPDAPKPIFSDEGLQVRDRPFIEKHPTRGFSLKPAFSNDLYAVNGAGFRGQEFPPDIRDRFVIVAMGESTTFGWKVRNGEDYPAYLMALLKKDNEKVYVVNAGVPSYSSSQVLLYLEEIVEKFHPGFVLVNVMWNDVEYSTILNWYPDALIYQKPPGWKVFLWEHSKFVRGLWLRSREKNSAFNVFNEQALLTYKENIAAMIRVCARQDVPLAFIRPPFDAEYLDAGGINTFGVHYTKPFFIHVAKAYLRAMESVANAHQVPVITHRLALDTPPPHALFQDALHPTPEGNLLMAQDIYQHLQPTLAATMNGPARHAAGPR